MKIKRWIDGVVVENTINPELKASPMEWPLWAKAIKQFSTPEDKGIGDVVARIIGDENSAKFKAFYLATFGKACGCAGRQRQWNLKYPLNDGVQNEPKS